MTFKTLLIVLPCGRLVCFGSCSLPKSPYQVWGYIIPLHRRLDFWNSWLNPGIAPTMERMESWQLSWFKPFSSYDTGPVLLMTCALGLGLDITIRSYMTLESSFQTLYAVDEVLKVWLSFASATDILIAASLAFEMRKRHTGLSKTDTVLNRIALYGAATGAVTATVVTTQLLLFTVGGMFEPIIFFGMYIEIVSKWLNVYPLGGIYITTFLANLHTRSSLRVLASQPQGAIELSNMPTSHAQFQVTVMTAVSQSHHL
ncbi:hypothetical protein DL93DRAFT_2153865 [Clavulina sp. PMI_390]|nr:hypothetical protein DL93DRAFT_2153865 [Clavulina sp. PMI_390]